MDRRQVRVLVVEPPFLSVLNGVHRSLHLYRKHVRHVRLGSRLVTDAR